jgi:hypothetical protein
MHRLCLALGFRGRHGASPGTAGWPEEAHIVDRTSVVARRAPARALGLVALLSLAGGPGLAAWTPTGAPICVAPGAQHDPISVIPWIVWTDERDGPAQAYVWWTEESVAGFPVNGLPLAPSDHAQLDVCAITTGYDGSLLVAWAEDRGAGTGSDIYLTRWKSGQLAQGWPADGVLVCAAVGEQRNPRLVLGFDYPPASAHVFVTWEDARSGTSQLFGSNVSYAGAITAGWPADGIPISAGEGSVRNAVVVSQDHGFVAVWAQAGRVMAQVVSDAGVVPGDIYWPAAGRALSDAAYTASNPAAIETYFYSPPYSAEVVVVWEETRAGHVQLRAQGWGVGAASTLTSEAVAVVEDTLARPHDVRLRYSNSYAEHVRVIWQDDRADAGDLYVSDLYLSPTSYPFVYAYPMDGVPMIAAPGKQGQVTVGWGEFWQDARSGVPQIFTRFYGEPGPTGGAVAPTGMSQTQPSASHPPGAYIPESPPPDFVVWTDMRNPATAPDVYAQVNGPGGPGTVGAPFDRPHRFAFSRATPTPSRGPVHFVVALPQAVPVELRIVDVTGRALRSLVYDPLPAGEHSLEWDGRDADGRDAPPGLYWARGTVGREALSRRIVLLPR